MPDRRLLQIIYEEGETSPTGSADGKIIAERYGGGFHRAFIGLIQAGYIHQGGMAGTITLSGSGRFAAKHGV
jgi:hypothetical protein